MRIVVCPSDREAPGYYRLGLPAMTLMEQDAGFEFHFVDGLPMVNAKGGPAVSGVDEPVALHPDLECDVLILQRPMARFQLVALESAQERGIRVVVELDDLVHAADRRGAFGSQVQDVHLRVLEECCRRADLLTVSTPALEARYGHGRTVVLPNYIPESWLSVTREDEGDCGCDDPLECDCYYQTVGWTGSIGNHVDDLRSTSRAIGPAMSAMDARFRCFGRGNEQARRMIATATGVSEYDLEVHPWQSRDRYPHEIVKFNVGIAPLADTAFNRAKSWLKPLEYAACGVPCVMSPTTEYRRIHEHYGIGALAGFGYANEWKREVGRLLADAGYREDVADKGRAAVAEHLTIEDNAWRWAEAWASTLAVAI